MPRAKDEVTITPPQETHLASFLVVADTSLQKSHFFLWFADTKGLLLCDIPRLFTRSALLILLRLRAVIERSKNLLLWVCLQQRPRCTNTGVVQRGGREKTVFLLRRQCSSERRELSDIENYTFTSNVLRRIPKWKQRAKSYSQKNSYISETATKHKAVSTSKVNLRTVHFLLHYPTCDRWTELCRISPYFISWRGTENGWTCKLYNLTLQTTYQTNVVSWIFICFIKRLFYRQPWTFRAQRNLCWI